MSFRLAEPKTQSLDLQGLKPVVCEKPTCLSCPAEALVSGREESLHCLEALKLLHRGQWDTKMFGFTLCLKARPSVSRLLAYLATWVVPHKA